MTETETRYVELEEFPGYRVGDDGTIQSRRKQGRGTDLRPDWRDLVPDAHGRLRLPSRDGGYPSVTIARLVLETFVGPPPDQYAVARFKDGDRTNRRLDNLYWGRFKGYARQRARSKATP